MKKCFFIGVFSLYIVLYSPAQTTFEWKKELTKANATVKQLNNGEVFAITPTDNANTRYLSEQLPEEYKKDGLNVSFTGWEGIIPPNFRMLGKPLKLKCICVTKAEQKKFLLKKRSYKFK